MRLKNKKIEPSSQQSEPPPPPRGRFRWIQTIAVSTIVGLLAFGGSQDHQKMRALQEKVLELVYETETNANYTTAAATTSHRHNPQSYSQNTQLNIDRGMNIINVWSGHGISAWVYHGTQELNSDLISWKDEPEEKLLKHPVEDAPKIQANDTVYVAIAKLLEFTTDFLPLIQQDFVLITGTWHIHYPNWLNQFSNDIVNHPNLLHWLSTNIANYTGGKQYHPKVSPFPLGLKPNMPGARIGSFRAPISNYRRIFLETINYTLANKTTLAGDHHIFAGYIRDTNEKRKNIPTSRNIHYPNYLRALAKSHYVLSPDGDHPDCHRHYEVLGMGAVPITELDPFLYRHLAGGPVIFNNTDWNLTSLNNTLPSDPPPVNRNIVFEEYWMEYVERVVGRPLRWWDKIKQKRCYLDEFARRMGSPELMVSSS